MVNSVPYFYIIRHISSSKMYAGSRWAVGCNPSELLQEFGYTTSSTSVNDLINSDGISSFEILRIDTNCDGLHPYDYESIFLQANNCKESCQWINKHNNNGEFMIELKELLFNKYGVYNASSLEWVTQKKLETYKIKHGDIPYSRDDNANKKRNSTNFIKYGSDVIFKSEYFIKKSKETKLLRYGDENFYDKEKSKKTRLLKYGGYNNTKKTQETNLVKYGVKFVSQVPEFKDKLKNTCNIRYGKSTFLNCQYDILKCIHCGITANSGNITRWHNDYCKQNPNKLEIKPYIKDKYCKYCQDYFISRVYSQCHDIHCKKNPNRVIARRKKKSNS